ENDTGGKAVKAHAASLGQGEDGSVHHPKGNGEVLNGELSGKDRLRQKLIAVGGFHLRYPVIKTRVEILPAGQAVCTCGDTAVCHIEVTASTGLDGFRIDNGIPVLTIC